MDSLGRIERRVLEINTPQAFFFRKLVRRRFYDQLEVHDSFLRILSEYTYGRLESDDMYRQVSRLFRTHPALVSGFTKAMSTIYDDVEKGGPAKKAKIEDDSPNAITVFDPTSVASTSYASNYSQSPCSSGCHPRDWEAVASGSSSSPSRQENAAQAYEARQKKNAQFIDGTLYITETETKLKDWPQAYEHFTELVNEIGAKRIDTYAIMEDASKLLQGYPDLIESLNVFLPDGYRIIMSSGDHEMSTD